MPRGLGSSTIKCLPKSTLCQEDGAGGGTNMHHNFRVPVRTKFGITTRLQSTKEVGPVPPELWRPGISIIDICRRWLPGVHQGSLRDVRAHSNSMCAGNITKRTVQCAIMPSASCRSDQCHCQDRSVTTSGTHGSQDVQEVTGLSRHFSASMYRKA